MSAPLVLAVPSKGRLQEDTTAAFASAGLELARSGASRRYRGKIVGIAGAEVAFLSAPEIAREIGAGAVHLGVTGRDQIEETVPDWQARRPSSRRSASAIATSWSPCRRPGSTSRRWKTSTTSPPASARVTGAG